MVRYWDGGEERFGIADEAEKEDPMFGDVLADADAALADAGASDREIRLARFAAAALGVMDALGRPDALENLDVGPMVVGWIRDGIKAAWEKPLDTAPRRR